MTTTNPAPRPTDDQEVAMSNITAAATIATAAELGLRVWTAGRRQVAPPGTQVIYRERLTEPLAVVTRDGQVLTSLAAAGREVPVELVGAYLAAVGDGVHRNHADREIVLRIVARQAGVQLA